MVFGEFGSIKAGMMPEAQEPKSGANNKKARAMRSTEALARSAILLRAPAQGWPAPGPPQAGPVIYSSKGLLEAGRSLLLGGPRLVSWVALLLGVHALSWGARRHGVGGLGEGAVFDPLPPVAA